jgi:hypothetical protein
MEEKMAESIDYRDHENAILARQIKDLSDHLRAYHDREWLEAHEGLPEHEAGELPDECEACNALIEILGPWPWD